MKVTWHKYYGKHIMCGSVSERFLNKTENLNRKPWSLSKSGALQDEIFQKILSLVRIVWLFWQSCINEVDHSVRAEPPPTHTHTITRATRCVISWSKGIDFWKMSFYSSETSVILSEIISFVKAPTVRVVRLCVMWWDLLYWCVFFIPSGENKGDFLALAIRK